MGQHLVPPPAPMASSHRSRQGAMLAPAGAAEDANVPIHGHTQPIPGCRPAVTTGFRQGTGGCWCPMEFCCLVLLKDIETC